MYKGSERERWRGPSRRSTTARARQSEQSQPLGLEQGVREGRGVPLGLPDALGDGEGQGVGVRLPEGVAVPQPDTVALPLVEWH